MNVDLTELYGKIAGPWVATLLGELLVLGFFFVLYNYIRLLVNKSKSFEGIELFKRFGLLAAVSLFVFYVDITYFLEYEQVDFESLIANFKHLSTYELMKSKILLLSLVPIDLLTVSILTGMFASLSIEVFVDESNTLAPSSDLSKVILWLYLFASLFHLVTLFWWLISYSLGNGAFPFYDILYHFSYFALHLINFFIWRNYFKKHDNNTLAVIVFVVLLLSVYITRIWWYLDKLVG